MFCTTGLAPTAPNVEGRARWVAFCLAIASLIALAACQDAKPIVDEDDTYAFVNVNIPSLDSEDISTHQTVIVSDGYIREIVSDDSVEFGARTKVIDGAGGYLLPGLVDMHAHISSCDFSSGLDVCSLPEHQLLIYAATGVTTVRDAGGSADHLRFIDYLEDGAWFGPQIVLASPIVEGEKAVWEQSIKVTTTEEARDLVRSLHEQGFWGVKVYHTISKEVFETIVLTAAELDFPVFGHVPFEVGIDHALESGLFSIEHMRGYDFDGLTEEELRINGGRSAIRFGSWLRMSEARKKELITKTKANEVANVPTLAVNRLLYDRNLRNAMPSDPRFRRLHPWQQDAIRNANALDSLFPKDSTDALQAAMPVMHDFVRALHEKGAYVLVGTDAVVPGYVPGFTVIDEIKSFAEAGLTNRQAIEAATLKPAQALGRDDNEGAIKENYKGNLILLRDNPIDDLDALWSLEGVMIDGQWRTLRALEATLDARVAQYQMNASGVAE